MPARRCRATAPATSSASLPDHLQVLGRDQRRPHAVAEEGVVVYGSSTRVALTRPPRATGRAPWCRLPGRSARIEQHPPTSSLLQGLARIDPRPSPRFPTAPWQPAPVVGHLQHQLFQRRVHPQRHAHRRRPGVLRDVGEGLRPRSGSRRPPPPRGASGSSSIRVLTSRRGVRARSARPARLAARPRSSRAGGRRLSVTCRTSRTASRIPPRRRRRAVAARSGRRRAPERTRPAAGRRRGLRPLRRAGHGEQPRRSSSPATTRPSRLRRSCP